jgi:hypothetical protein
MLTPRHFAERSLNMSNHIVRPLVAALASLSLAACATCRDHPVACGVGVAILAGSIAATAAAHHSGSPHALPGMSTQPVSCTNGACN